MGKDTTFALLPFNTSPNQRVRTFGKIGYIAKNIENH